MMSDPHHAPPHPPPGLRRFRCSRGSQGRGGGRVTEWAPRDYISQEELPAALWLPVF